jgi:hypothetical protein
VSGGCTGQRDGIASPGTLAGQEWEVDGPGDDQRQVWLWDTRYIPYERLTPGQHAARDALRLRVRSLAATPGEILHASYAGFKPANVDVENLVLHNIDATGGDCFRLAVRHGGALRSAMSFAPSWISGTDLPSMCASSGNCGTYSLLPRTLGRRSSSDGATGAHRSQDRPRPCLLHVCSDVPVRAGSGRHHAAAGLTVCRTARHVIA